MLKGRFILQNWMTSLSHQSLTIHRINHKETQLLDNGQVIIPSSCGQRISEKNLVLLSDDDAYYWSLNHGVFAQKYGPRKQCKWCG